MGNTASRIVIVKEIIVIQRPANVFALLAFMDGSVKSVSVLSADELTADSSKDSMFMLGYSSTDL